MPEHPSSIRATTVAGVHRELRVQLPGSRLALLSSLLPTFGFLIPLGWRIAGVAIGLLMLAYPILVWLAQVLLNQIRRDRRVIPLLIVAFGLLITAGGSTWLFLRPARIVALPEMPPPSLSASVPSPNMPSVDATLPPKSLSSTDKEELGKIYKNILMILQHGENASKDIDFSRSAGDPPTIKYNLSRLDKNISDIDNVQKEIKFLEDDSSYQFYHDTVRNIELSDSTGMAKQPIQKLASDLRDVRFLLGELHAVSSNIKEAWDPDGVYKQQYAVWFSDIGIALVAPVKADNNAFRSWIEGRRRVVLSQREALQ
jgi:hypothetical protein